MNILFLGDVTAESGRKAVSAMLPNLKKEYEADFTIINAENAAHGKGITERIYRELKTAGADVITLGNHAFAKREFLSDIDQCPDVIRPANMYPKNIGKSFVVRNVKGKRIAVMNVIGSIFMHINVDDPGEAIEDMLNQIEADIYILDFHGETTSEKAVYTWYFKNVLTAVIGTHTHVQTADERLIDGCAFISDAGMCGPYDSVLGRDIDEVIAYMVEGESTRYTPATGKAVICGVLIQIDDETNRAEKIERIQIRP